MNRNARSRIVFVNRFYAPDDTATSQMARDVAVELAPSADVWVITSRRILVSRDALLPSRERLDGVEVVRVWTPSLGRGIVARALDFVAFYVMASWQLARRLRRGDVVVSLTDPPLISVIAALVARLRGARLVNWLQDVYPEAAVRLGVLKARSLPVRWMMRLRNASLRRADANVALGEYMQRHVRGVEPAGGRTVVIPNWFEEIGPCPSPNPYRAALKVPDDCFVVGYAGNLGRFHRFDGLVEASRLLRESGRFHFLIIGAGAQRVSLEAEVRTAGVDACWTFLDYQPRTRAGEFLRAIDLHIISLEPLLEGLVVPSKLYGVLAAGRGSVFLGRRDSEVATILAEENCGAALEPGDAPALANMILRLSRDAGIRGEWERRARACYERRFSRAVAVSKWRGLMHELGVC